MGGFWQLTKPMQSSEETLPASISAAMRKFFGFLTVHLAHCQGAQLHCNFMYRLGFLKMQGWVSTITWDLSLQLGDIMASRLPGTGRGTCKPRELLFLNSQISAQWWSQSFSLKYMNTMTVIVKSMWTKLLPTNLRSFIEKASLWSIGKTNKQTKYGYTKWSDFC